MNRATKTKESLLAFGKQTGVRSSFPCQMRASVLLVNITARLKWSVPRKKSDMESKRAEITRKTWVQTDAKLGVRCLFRHEHSLRKLACWRAWGFPNLLAIKTLKFCLGYMHRLTKSICIISGICVRERKKETSQQRKTDIKFCFSFPSPSCAAIKVR